jgi:hypothetical protein
LETQLAREIDRAEKDAKYDRYCKNLLADRAILAHIMKECVSEFKDFDVKYIAENCIEGTPQISETAVHVNNKPRKIVSLNTEDSTMDEGVVFFDIKFVAVLPQTGENIRLIINIEAQNKYNPGYSLIRRGLYYCCRLISSQYETEFKDGDYDSIKKVYSIWICTDTPDYAKNTITKYKITEENLVGNMKANLSKYDLLNVIMVCLDKDSEDVQSMNKDILKLLRVLLSGVVDSDKKKVVLNEDFDIEMTVEMERKMRDMCNLSAGIREDALRQGVEQGLRQGVEQGAELKDLEYLRKFMKKFKITFEEAADMLDLSESDKKKYAKII